MDTGQILNHYQITGKLGQGGMGEVYRARDTKLNREVAIKVLPAVLTADAERHTRFHREAQLLAAFTHPHVASIHSLEEDAGRHFLVMELVEGDDLSARIAPGPLPVIEALEFARQIASALEAAHVKGIVHRDLKPANVKLTTDGQIKVLDFGLAKVREDEAAVPGDSAFHDSPTMPPDVTRQGVILGTAAYMSPEQARGLPVDRRADIWAFGCVLYEMLTGRKAFAGESVSDTLAAVLRSEPDPAVLPDDMPVAARRLLRRCLRKDQRQRLHDIADARIAIEDILAEQDPSSVSDLDAFGASMKAPGPGAAPAIPGPRRRWPAVVATLGWLLAGLFALGLIAGDESASVPARVETLTFSGRDWSPDASPDGDFIVFASDRTGSSRIWLKQLASGSEVPITDGADDLPRISPDGSQVLFVRDEGAVRHLYRMPIFGGQPRKLLDDVSEADWSPTGDQVAFIRSEANDAGDNVFHVGIADVQSAQERILARVVNRTTYGVRWSPDGRRLLVCQSSLTGNVAEAAAISVVNVADGSVWSPEVTPYDGPFSAPEWSPDSRSVLIGQGSDQLAHVTGASGPIMQIDLENVAWRPLFWAPIRMPRGGWTFSSFAALDADRVVFDVAAVRSVLYEIDLEDPRGRQTPTRLTDSLGRDRQPVYSPDGRLVAFSSNRSGNIDIWTYDRRTGQLQQLTDDPSDDWDPAFSPDGREILWSSNRSGPLEIWMANADGSAARKVTDDGVSAENPTMTPDRRWIVYASTNDTRAGIWRIRPDGTEATRIHEGASLLPEISPDGRYAIFVVFQNLDYQIRAVEVETGTTLPVRINIDTRERHQPVVFGRGRWTPDGRGVVYIGQSDEGHIGVHAQDFAPDRDTMASRRELYGFARGDIVESLGLSPDGRHLTVSVVEQRRILKMAESVGLRGWSQP